MSIPKKVLERVQAGLKRLRPVIEQQRVRDVSEADTVTLVKDLLAEVFGYDKYAELTSEHAIRATFCDLAVKLEGKLVLLIEVKAIGTTLDDRHVRQAIDYAANQGCEWVILTNAISWRLYHVIFAKPIDKQLVAEIDILSLDLRSEGGQGCAFLLTKEGFRKGAHVELRDRKQATSRFLLAALITRNDSVMGAIRRELRRVVDVLVDEHEIAAVLRDQVLKRDTLEGPDAEEAIRRVTRKADRSIQSRPSGGKSAVPELTACVAADSSREASTETCPS